MQDSREEGRVEGGEGHEGSSVDNHKGLESFDEIDRYWRLEIAERGRGGEQ